ncbi:MAG: amidohydrolase, partial [Gemmatimonadales bacterium]
MKPVVSLLLVASTLGPVVISAQTMTVDEYNPKSTLVVPGHPLTRSRFPVVDVHSHHRTPSRERVDTIIADMNTMNMAVMVNLSGGTGETLVQSIEA